MTEKTMKPGPALMQKVRQAFLDHGYSELSMVGLAKACGFTRRALYHYFSSKEDAFKASISDTNAHLIQTGLEAGDAVRKAGDSALDVVSEIMNERYGFTRRALNLSPHIVELNAEAFRRCRDNMIESAITFQNELEKLLIEFDREGLLHLKSDFTAGQVAQILADGGRAVNQSLPPIPTEKLAGRYREMCKAILYGGAAEPG